MEKKQSSYFFGGECANHQPIDSERPQIKKGKEQSSALLYTLNSMNQRRVRQEKGAPKNGCVYGRAYNDPEKPNSALRKIAACA